MGKGLVQTISRMALMAFLGLAIVGPGAGAQTEAAGKFSLAFDARWGGMALGPGEYTFSVEEFRILRVQQGQKELGVVLLQSYDGVKGRNEDASLICIRHDGACAVRVLTTPDVGTFYFAVPKDERILVAKQPELLQRVAIQMAGK
ncbi:MAG TPA: hypothetical protein VIH76_06215 [Candidatus Acidoferrales bacterium]